METPNEIYRILYLAVKSASDIERLLREQNDTGNRSSSADKILKALDDITGNELPVCMGKLISQLELQGAFQSLGRYVRNFGDAEFVVRNMKEQILDSLNKGLDNVIISGVNNFISCCINVSNEKGFKTLV